MLFLIKNRKNPWKKSSKFFDSFFFKFFTENVIKNLLQGFERTRKKYWIVFEKVTFLDKNSKKSRKKVRTFLINLLIFLLLSFSQKSRKKSSKGRGTTRKKYRLVFEKYTVFDKKSKKSLKKKNSSKFFHKFNYFIIFFSFSQEMS